MRPQLQPLVYPHRADYSRFVLLTIDDLGDRWFGRSDGHLAARPADEALLEDIRGLFHTSWDVTAEVVPFDAAMFQRLGLSAEQMVVLLEV